MKKINLFILFFSFVILALCAFLIYYTVDRSLIASSSEADKKDELTVIIDAGHGGIDGGAVGSDGTEEKDINLYIAKDLEKILNTYGIKTIMTRTDDNSIHSQNAATIREQKVSDIHNRMKIMEENENCLFISIHQNSFPNSSLWGTQVFYSPNTTSSPELADCIQNSVIKLIQPENKRIVKKCGSSVYLLYYAKKPAVLVECGFMTNNNELKMLKDEEYRRKMAFSVACGVLDYLGKGC